MNHRIMNVRIVILLIVTLVAIQVDLAIATDHVVHLQQEDGRIRVTDNNELFCEVDYTTYAKPIVYPIYGPGQIPMTRNHPMKPGTAKEASDHPHHKSMWFAHGDVNGVSFWNEQGKVVNQSAEILTADALSQEKTDQPTIRLKNLLIDPEGETVCQETATLGFGADDNVRWIDWTISLRSDDHPVTFGDTKEGTAALRVHPHLRPDQKATQGTDIAPAKAINSAGQQGKAIWGQRAKWVDYTGTIDGHRVGIAFFDNPRNFRHPTYWHARTYGLFSANPFGLSYFEGEGANGSHTVPAGESFTQRYRIVFHMGDAERANVDGLYQTYAQQWQSAE